MGDTTRPSKLPPIIELAERVRNGEDSRVIAQQYGISRATLMNRFQVAGFATNGVPTQVEERRDLKTYLSTVKRTWAEPWMAEGTCRSVGPEAFYPEYDAGPDARAARRICDQCPVLMQCEDFVMAMEMGWSTQRREGIWAGRTPAQRKRYEPVWLEIQAEGAA